MTARFIGQTMIDFDCASNRAHWAAKFSLRAGRPAGETESAAASDLAVAAHCGQIAMGSPARSDRLAKDDQLLHIEQRLRAVARSAGGSVVKV